MWSGGVRKENTRNYIQFREKSLEKKNSLGKSNETNERLVNEQSEFVQ